MTIDRTVLQLNVAPDHVASLTKFKNPIRGIEELVWNALDADATAVEVMFQMTPLGGFDAVVVKDNGLGIDPATKDQCFGNLGGSPKRKLARTTGGRVVHGKEGKGRFRAFRLGSRVEWKSRFKTKEGIVEWTITGDSFDLTRFRLSQPTVTPGAATGTVVTVTNVDVSLGQLSSEGSQKELLLRLAIYLRKYPSVRVMFGGVPLDVRGIFANEASYPIEAEDSDGTKLTGNLNIIEWKTPVERRLYLCTSDGFARFEEPPGIQAKGFDFTAYLMTPAVEGMNDNDVDLVEMRPELTALREAAKQRLREHFKQRETDKLRSLVELWKVEGIYPYDEGGPTSPVAEAEREVFNICAISVYDRLPAFEKTDTDNKKLTMRLLKQALESNPGSLQTILKEVLNLPKQAQDDLAELLQRTKLSSIIKAAKVVGDRLTFIQSLRFMLFDPTMHKKLKERSQLQRILVNELWVFGDQYALGLDDQSLKALLATHAKLLGRDILAEDVKDINGEQAIPDLMLYRKFADRTQGQYEHLVIELKRPSVDIGSDELAQIKKYAFTVAADPRFEKGKTKWNFIAISNDFDAIVEAEARQAGRAYGHVHQGDSINIYVRKWAGAIQDCEWRHEFYRKELDVEIQAEDATAYLRKRYPNYVPSLPESPASASPPSVAAPG